MTSPKAWAAVSLALLLLVLLVLAAFRVPWTAPPAPRADQLAALHDMPADAVAKGRAFHAALRPGVYGGLLLGLVIALVLGLTPLGARVVALAGRP
ncbi:MAG: M48 family peptidase, partial [Micromonosporaceae bacterium]